MARLPRFPAPGMPQHVIQRGNNRSATFAADSDFLFYRDCLAAACERYECRVHAYVLMTNHVHLLITSTTPCGISKVMQTVGRRYVRRFNDRHQRTGTLWEGRYRAALIESDRYLLTCYRYIELNPVRAGIVTDPRDYRWSSYRANALGTRDPIVSPHAEYGALGADELIRREAYRALFKDAVAEATLEAIRDATNKGWALGRERFHETIRRLLHRRPHAVRVSRAA